MDSDLSHPPESIPSLLAPLADGSCDMIIGSRYMPGGGTPDWPLFRRIALHLAARQRISLRLGRPDPAGGKESAGPLPHKKVRDLLSLDGSLQNSHRPGLLPQQTKRGERHRPGRRRNNRRHGTTLLDIILPHIDGFLIPE